MTEQELGTIKAQILKQGKSEKFLRMNPYVAFDSNFIFIAFAPTEAQAKEAAIIKCREHFPSIIDVRTLKDLEESVKRVAA